MARPEADPFTEEDALQEAALVDVRINALSGRSRSPLRSRRRPRASSRLHGDTHRTGHRSAQLGPDPRPRGPIWYTVVGSTSQVEGDCLTLALDLLPDAELRIRLRSGTFYVGDVPGLCRRPATRLHDGRCGHAVERHGHLGVRVRTILCGRPGAPVLSPQRSRHVDRRPCRAGFAPADGDRSQRAGRAGPAPRAVRAGR